MLIPDHFWAHRGMASVRARTRPTGEEGQTMTAMRPFQLPPDGGRTIWHLGGALMRFKAVSEDTNGQFWLAEQVSDKGYASPLHRHTKEDELFLVLEGELRVGVGEQVMEVPAGGVAFAPRGLPHTFRVESPSARFLLLSTPGG